MELYNYWKKKKQNETQGQAKTIPVSDWLEKVIHTFSFSRSDFSELSRSSLESASHLQGDLRWASKHQNGGKAVKSEMSEEPQAEKHISSLNVSEFIIF